MSMDEMGTFRFIGMFDRPWTAKCEVDPYAEPMAQATCHLAVTPFSRAV